MFVEFFVEKPLFKVDSLEEFAWNTIICSNLDCIYYIDGYLFIWNATEVETADIELPFVTIFSNISYCKMPVDIKKRYVTYDEKTHKAELLEEVPDDVTSPLFKFARLVKHHSNQSIKILEAIKEAEE